MVVPLRSLSKHEGHKACLLKQPSWEDALWLRDRRVSLVAVVVLIPALTIAQTGV